ncbi:class I adenylate-forming enzyme family protein [Desulfallas thermosapovorans]|uniref:Feruloyl-CoA synthase n=1 Tax=Desulfallas thermosapovorans DSM 6562 TaxID=1121431 RepID=A0A5S4ZSC6_9FIRM|nr:long-chain-fatty-acid--CoA ligase [Desulfallas thermosapovorans]TYO94958.1 feruloyl-CoA synthase [Desulfallas thermosapovorans DSM 6562]
MNLIEILNRNASKFPNKDCLRYNGQGITFVELLAQAEKSAAILQSWGVNKGDKVAIMSYNTPAFVIAFYGALKAGAAVVPVNHKLAAPEISYILEHSESKVLFFDGALGEVVRKVPVQARMVAIGSDAEGFDRLERIMDNAPNFTHIPIEDHDPAEILYTSGTTGKPKGCLHSHKNVVFAGITGALAVKMDEQDRLLMAMPIWHSSPLNNWFIGAQFIGATTVLLREYHPLHFLQTIQEEKCTVYFGAPISYIMPLQVIPNFSDFDLSSMRCWIYGGGPIAGDTAIMLMEKYQSKNFFQVYGMTEAGPTGTVLSPRDQIRKAGSIGCNALPGADLRVMKNETEHALPGETGEIWLNGDSIMAGYYKNPGATAEAFYNGWYKTGDVARLDADGYLYIVDRTKDMIVTGGENVYSKEVEDAIASHPAVMESAVIGRPHPEWGETVIALVVLKTDTTINEKELKEYLSERLAKYKIPREIIFTDSLPHTPTGKVKKFELREQYNK